MPWPGRSEKPESIPGRSVHRTQGHRKGTHARGTPMSRRTSTPSARKSRTPDDVAPPENRRHSRVVVSLPARCARVIGKASPALRGHTANLGGGGLALELQERLAPGSRVTVEIHTAIGPFRIEADVMWTRRLQGKEGVVRHGLCLAGQSELMDLPIHALLGRWLQGLARTRGASSGIAAEKRSRRPRKIG